MFEGSDAEATYAGKIRRAENLTWDPPCLNFRIERHGGIVSGGSTRAKMQEWSVDVEKATATCSVGGQRQLHPMAPRLDVRLLADQVARAILADAEHPAIKWGEGHTSFRLRIAGAVPSDGFRQTVAGRRRRFRDALQERLPGWRQAGAGRWERLQISHDSSRSE